MIGLISSEHLLNVQKERKLSREKVCRNLVLSHQSLRVLYTGSLKSPRAHTGPMLHMLPTVVRASEQEPLNNPVYFSFFCTSVNNYRISPLGKMDYNYQNTKCRGKYLGLRRIKLEYKPNSSYMVRNLLTLIFPVF